MKLQLEANSLRIRLSEAELATLQAQQAVEALLPLAANARCRLRIRLCPDPVTDEQRWRLLVQPLALLDAELSLTAGELQDYVSTLPSRDGLRWLVASAHGDLQLTLEVDVRDSIGVRGHRTGKIRQDS